LNLAGRFNARFEIENAFCRVATPEFKRRYATTPLRTYVFPALKRRAKFNQRYASKRYARQPKACASEDLPGKPKARASEDLPGETACAYKLASVHILVT